MTDGTLPTVRLRDRLRRLTRRRGDDASRLELVAELSAGMQVLAVEHCRDGCSLGMLLRDADGYWPVITEQQHARVSHYGMTQFEVEVDLGFSGPFPSVLDAFAGLFPSCLPDQWRDEWVEGLLAVAYLDSDHETAAEVGLLVALTRQDVAASLVKQRTVRANMAYQEDLHAAFARALTAQGMDDVPLETALSAANNPAFIGDMWLADREDWPELAHQFLELWDLNGRPGAEDSDDTD